MLLQKIWPFHGKDQLRFVFFQQKGAIGNVKLRQPATSGGTFTYEGSFDIISLSGSYMLTENSGTRSRNSGLSVALAGSDGHVLGGGVDGMLVVAGPVQVVFGSFIAEGKKPKPDPIIREPSAPNMPGLGAASVSTPPSVGTSSESPDDPGSLVNQCGGTCNNSGLLIQSMPSYSSVVGPTQ